MNVALSAVKCAKGASGDGTWRETGVNHLEKSDEMEERRKGKKTYIRKMMKKMKKKKTKKKKTKKKKKQKKKRKKKKKEDTSFGGGCMAGVTGFARKHIPIPPPSAQLKKGPKLKWYWLRFERMDDEDFSQV
jgi:hypothetical protein